MDRSFCALQNQLNERFSDEERSQLSRHNILDLMIILKNFVGSCMDEHLGELECGTPYVAAHNATTLIKEFILAFEALDVGKTDRVFVASGVGKNAARSWRDREEDNLYRTALQLMIEHENNEPQKKIASKLAKTLNSHRYKIRGQRVTAQKLINLLYR